MYLINENNSRTFYPIKFEPRIIDTACLNLDDENKTYQSLMVSG